MRCFFTYTHLQSFLKYDFDFFVMEVYMQYQLEQVSTLFPGVSNKVYSEKDIQGSKQIFLLKGNDLDHEGNVSLDDAKKVYIEADEKLKKLLLKENDVLVLARGSAIRAGIITKKTAQMEVIANSTFIIIRPDANKVRAEMLVAFFNSKFGRNQLLELSEKCQIKNIPIIGLKNLELSVPHIDIQHRIVDIYHASKEAQQATKKLLEQQKLISNEIILNLMHGVS